MPLDGKQFVPVESVCVLFGYLLVVLGCVENGISTKSGNSESAGSRDRN
jgi:hypothetical protein